jgi:hypothetical protein
MFTLTSRKSLIIWITILSIIGIILILPIKISYNLFVRGKILPVTEWIIYKGTDGRLTSQLINYKTGINKSYDVTLFDRGDAMQFEFISLLAAGSTIKQYDTIAVIYSNENERQIENLKGEIIAAKASLSLNLTGEKEAVIDQEIKNLDYAVKQADEQKKILDRFSALYQKGLASQEEYEIAKGTYDLFLINISISQARLKTVETGAKQEQIGFIKTQIISLENELAILQKRFKGFTLTAPINGIVSRKTNSDTLLIISDISEFVLLCPVKVIDKKYIQTSANVDIHANGTKLDVKSFVYEIDNNVQLINGIQIVTVSSAIKGKCDQLIPSLIVDCYIETGKLSPLEYLERIWQRMVN